MALTPIPMSERERDRQFFLIDFRHFYFSFAFKFRMIVDHLGLIKIAQHADGDDRRKIKEEIIDLETL